MLNKERVLRFLEVQNLVNREIDVYGQATEEMADLLDELGDQLTEQDIEYIFELTL